MGRSRVKYDRLQDEGVEVISSKDEKVKNVKVKLGYNKAIVTWKYPLKKNFLVQVKKDGYILHNEKVSETRFEWSCSPPYRYQFSVKVENATKTVWSDSLYTVKDAKLAKKSSNSGRSHTTEPPPTSWKHALPYFNKAVGIGNRGPNAADSFIRLWNAQNVFPADKQEKTSGGKKVKKVKAKLENNKAIVTWKYVGKKKFIIQVKEDGNIVHEKTVSKRKFEWSCRPSNQYEFSLKIENATESVWSNSLYTAPSKISNVTSQEKSTLYVISWPRLKNEDVSYNVAVHCNDELLDEVRNIDDCSYELDFDNPAYQPGSYEFKVCAVSRNGGLQGEACVHKLHIGEKVKDVEAKLENNKAILTWKYLLKKKFIIQVKRDGNIVHDETVSVTKLEWSCCPSHQYDFSVTVETAMESVWSNSLYTAPSRISNVTSQETATSYVILWPRLENEDVSYHVIVHCDDKLLDEVQNKDDCSYELDFNNPACQPGSYEFKVWAVSRNGGLPGTACVHKLHIGENVKDVKAKLENIKAIVTWKYLLKKKFIIQVKEDGNIIHEETVSETKLAWSCHPSHQYDFSVKVENATKSVWSNSVCTAPSKISNVTLQETSISYVISWPRWENEDVSYNVTVHCNDELLDEIRNIDDCSYELDFNNPAYQPGSYEFKVWAVSRNGGLHGEACVHKLHIASKESEGDVNNVTEVVPIVKSTVDKQTVSRGSVTIDEFTKAPSRISNVTSKEKSTSYVISWPRLENEDVSYNVAVHCNDELLDEVQNIDDCSYELDLNNPACQPGSYEFKVWAVSRNGRLHGEACVHKLHIGEKVKDVKAKLENNKAILTWKYLLKKKFIIQVKEDGNIIHEGTVFKTKLEWSCRPSHQYDFSVKVENATESVWSNSVYTAPSKISNVTSQEKLTLYVISWPRLENEDVSYNVIVHCNDELLDEVQNKDDCSYELDFNNPAYQPGSFQFKVWAVSRNGGLHGEACVHKLHIGENVKDVKAKLENNKAVVTWKYLLKKKFIIQVKKDDNIVHEETVSVTKLEWSCHPSHQYDFSVKVENAMESVWSNSLYTVLKNECIGVWDEPITNEFISSMVEILKKSSNTDMRDIEFCDCSLTAEHLEKFSNRIKDTECKIRSLTISFMKNIKGLIDIICSIVQKHGILSLSLIYDELNDGDIESLQEHLILKKVEKLQVLNLSYNEDISFVGFQRIGKIMHYCNTSSLIAVDCDITDEKLENFFLGLKDGDKLRNLNISRNTMLKSRGFRTLAQFLAKRGLESLHMCGCELSKDDIVNFKESHPKTRSLKQLEKFELDVSYNPTLEIDVSFASLVTSYGVTNLSLAGCELGEEDLTSLIKSKNDKLKTINMRDNKSLGKCMTKIAELVKVYKLCELNISDCMISTHQLRSFKKALEGYKLERLHLGDRGRKLDQDYVEEIGLIEKNVDICLQLYSSKLSNTQRSSLQNDKIVLTDNSAK